VSRFNTFCEVRGREANVVVDADWWPDEPDVGAASGFEINSVVEEDTDIMDLMSEYELDQLSLRIGELIGDEDDRGDFLYDQMKDARMERE